MLSFSCDVGHGCLFVEHFSEEREGFMFAPHHAKSLRLQIVDPEAKVISFQMNRRLGGHGKIKLFDLNGGLVCKKYLTDDVKDGMWQYVQ
jgi:hypothetical protein